MNLSDLIYKVTDRIKLFGVSGSLKRTFLFTFKPVFKRYSNIILVVPNHKSREYIYNDLVQEIHIKNVNQWITKKIISDEEAIRFKLFLNNNCRGYYIEENNDLAAWGFVQTQGKYWYGQYCYNIPEGVHILKNLFVKPEYRGRSYGKLINEARINSIPSNYFPVGFVIPENRYALRNLKIFGFEEYLAVKHTSWFKRWDKMSIKIIQAGAISDKLSVGFKN
jgi:GNAT superfamily N-acetyltransferase